MNKRMMIPLDNQAYFKPKMIGDREKLLGVLLLMEWKIQVYQEHFNSNFHNNHLYLQD
jgi:hypothetical protein